MSARELKPCPFCGGTPKEIVDATRILGVHRIVHRCAVIPPVVLEAATPEGVSEQWNRRADLPPGYVILSPDEVRAMERDRQAVEFAARWCWRTDPPNAHNKLTDAERLSVIKHHPTIKQYGQPHIELAERENSLKGDRDAQ